MPRQAHKSNRNQKFNPYRNTNRFLSQIKKSIDTLRKETNTRKEKYKGQQINSDEKKKWDDAKWTDIGGFWYSNLTHTDWLKNDQTEF